MNKAEYPVVIHSLCEEDGGGFTALAPDLNGCRGDGETMQDAVACLFEAMDEWADEMVRLGRDVPAPYSLAERVAEDKDALYKLVDAQTSLIKAQEVSLKEQNASIGELKDQVALLQANVSKFDACVPSMPVGLGKLWKLEGKAAVAAPKRMPIVRRQHHVSH